MKSNPKTAKFVAGERVLCYEPDLTMARVVYDAKILKIENSGTSKKNAAPGKDSHYLIHFQGWGSSWDRFVNEDFLLKYTEENRELQKNLFLEAELASKQLRKKMKKRKSKDDPDSPASQPDADDGQPTAKRSSWAKTLPSDVDEEQSISSLGDELSVEATSSSKELSSTSISPSSASALTNAKPAAAKRSRTSAKASSSSDGEVDRVVKLSENLKRILESDRSNVKDRAKLPVLPANPNVASVLEDFVRHYAASRLVSYEKQLAKKYYTAARKESGRELYSQALESINVAKEIADGLRVIFDFNLKNCLLYTTCGESSQYYEAMRPGNFVKRSAAASFAEQRPKRAEKWPQMRERRASSSNEVIFSCVASSTDDTSTNSGRSSSSRALTSLNPPAASPSTPQAMMVLRDLQNWRLVPDSMYENEDDVPIESLVYGPVHLLRLFVKMPEILTKMQLTPKTSRLVVKYMDSVLDYLSSHQDLFSNDAEDGDNNDVS